MYSNQSNSVQGLKMLMSTHMFLALMVLMMLFHNIFDVFRSAVIAVIPPG